MPVLASGSAIRRQLLHAAGVTVTCCPVDVDEDALRQRAHKDGLSLRETALTLAHAKAEAASPRHPGRLIIAADQILELEGRAFAKPADLTEARTHLQALRGKTHALHTAVTFWKDGRTLWSHVASPTLTMRPFSDDFLAQYLQTEGTAILSCVGCYRIEGLGIQLFDSVSGSSDTIAGLPLIPLLAALRQHDALPV
ncbi:Maf family protein [Bombella sp. TMW 2.2559]|uniref:Nucleoside triphosphate pyrophosphatase n=1 Tax=Bombella dulcis TaxID=2967339 RepID=A0ABT3WC66_9PROT|nr:nucleoside triphosphate pyrophosphatase [Bombella dulcis]MCX5616448.1 Maf family protein [Bombella dulcis]